MGCRARIAALIFSIGVASQVAHAGKDDIDALYAQVTSLTSEQRYLEALPIAERYLKATAEQHGDSSVEYADSLTTMGSVYLELSKFSEAESALSRSLDIYEREGYQDDPSISPTLEYLASAHSVSGNFKDSEALLLRAIAIDTKAHGLKSVEVANHNNYLGVNYWRQGNNAAAEKTFLDVLPIYEREFGKNSAQVATVVGNIAVQRQERGDYVEAETAYRRVVTIRERELGSDNPLVGQSLGNLGTLLSELGRFGEAEPILKRALSLSEAAYGTDDISTALALNNLGALYLAMGRHDDALALMEQALTINEKLLGKDSPDVGTALVGLSSIYFELGRYADAERAGRRALTIFEVAFGPDHEQVAVALNNLGVTVNRVGRRDEAVGYHVRAKDIREKANASSTYESLNNLANVYVELGRRDEAKALYLRSIELMQKMLGPNHPNVSVAYNSLGFLAYAMEDWSGARNYWFLSSEILRRRFDAASQKVQAAVSKDLDARDKAYHFTGFVKASYILAEKQSAGERAVAAAETFEAGQRALHSQAAEALSLLAARRTPGDPKLRKAIRDRQDLVRSWEAANREALVARSRLYGGDNEEMRSQLSKQSEAIGDLEQKLRSLDELISARFPGYATLASSSVLPVAEVQARISGDEAVIMLLDTLQAPPKAEETFVWVITPQDVRWVRSPLGTEALQREVAALRCGLDLAMWKGEGAKTCAELTGLASKPRTLHFDTKRSYELFKGLLGEVQQNIAGKRLLIVPSGALQQLPFQVLVTADPKEGIPPHWLIQDHEITILPSVASLQRPSAEKRGANRQSFLAFANPALKGNSATVDRDTLVAMSEQKTTCAKVRAFRDLEDMSRTFSLMDGPVQMHDGLADVEKLTSLSPIPETADLACDVAKSLRAPDDKVVLSTQATESRIKKLSASGELLKYSVVMFATHGSIGGEMAISSQPGLILSPPKTPSNADDGYLAASDVMDLQMDADWVILAACNSAAGNGGNAEALSGLAKSFFYAGARSLLASHWAVREDAAATIVADAVRLKAAQPSLSAAGALRSALLPILGSGDPIKSEPAYWAPLVIVGTGAS
ncbi:CHAT domain-containing tetratricopeptide repeat protein [uncultured Hyphomicrobium sp.]|uniref:CHAT domain-containing tetratricopeptide repeat protein n=1 Tax=uncultured Hyphomicrobium sp. TaxID=194373 RepID=UPI0025F00A07|nr:CHAT domain-containing tetratricopeptide repeat protein [uncultured Hyphomicrobium sp.]